MAEAQAVDRVHRIGQTRDVKITRYIIKDSVEEVSCVCYLVSHVQANHVLTSCAWTNLAAR